jgi:membrane-associated phospholipid phosphatase
LRVGSGEHFWTDVLVGAVVGSAFGVLIPTLHRRADGAHPLLPSWVVLTPGPGAGLGISAWY